MTDLRGFWNPKHAALPTTWPDPKDASKRKQPGTQEQAAIAKMDEQAKSHMHSIAEDGNGKHGV